MAETTSGVGEETGGVKGIWASAVGSMTKFRGVKGAQSSSTKSNTDRSELAPPDAGDTGSCAALEAAATVGECGILLPNFDFSSANAAAAGCMGDVGMAGEPPFRVRREGENFLR